MTKKIIECFFGVVISIIVIFIAIMCIFFFAVTFPQGEEWEMMEIKQIIPIIICSLVFMFSLTIGLKHWRSSKKHLAISINILPLIFLCVFTFKAIEELNYYAPFDKIEWNKSEYKDKNMTVTLLKNKKLIGLSRTEILNKLGDCNGKYDSQDTNTLDILSYSVQGGWQLIVYLEKGIVTQVKLKDPYSYF